MSKPIVHKIKFDLEEEGNVLGISSGFADYRMAWELNNSLELQLLLSNEMLTVYEKKSTHPHNFRVHHFFVEETMTSYYLIKNKQFNTYMAPDRPQIDYYLVIKNLDEIQLDAILSKLRAVNGVSAVFDFSNEYFEATDYLTF